MLHKDMYSLTFSSSCFLSLSLRGHLRMYAVALCASSLNRANHGFVLQVTSPTSWMFCSVYSWVSLANCSCETGSCRDIGCSMGGNGIRALVGAVVSLGIIVFLLVGILANSAPRVPSTEKVKTLRFSGEDVNLFHVSKRKVPNGPDPIHNRKAETSRRPPRV